VNAQDDLLKNDVLNFSRYSGYNFTGEMDKFIIFWCETSSGFGFSIELVKSKGEKFLGIKHKNIELRFDT